MDPNGRTAARLALQEWRRVMGDGLKELVDEERKLDAEIKDLEGRRKAMRDLITDELRVAKLDKAEVGGYALSIVKPKPAERLDKAKLIQAGVTPDQLTKGTIVTPRAEYLSVRKAGEPGE